MAIATRPWACAITGALWLLFYFVSDVYPQAWLAKPFAIAGQNVLLAYLLSEMLPSVLDLLHLDTWYSHLAQPDLAHAVARSIGCALFINFPLRCAESDFPRTPFH